MIVVKVGGSLFDWPALAERLRAYLASLEGQRVLLFPGGGASADVVRTLDRIHGLGEEASHWLAIQALSVNSRLLHRLVPGSQLLADCETAWLAGPIAIADPVPIFEADERRPDHWPHSWEVTSDSLAVRVAMLAGADELILLKSVEWAGADWAGASHVGVVDGYFSTAIRQAARSMKVRVVNLREWK